MTNPEHLHLPPSLDHLVFAAPNLARGMEHVEALLGARAVAGGSHPTFGTRNALLALGPTSYLEIIAPDPDLDPPGRGRLIDANSPLRLVTWVARHRNPEHACRDSLAAGVDLGGVEDCSRQRPDGSILRWRLTSPYAPRMGGVIPFLIDWGESPHPSAGLPSAGELDSITLTHPQPDLATQTLAALGLPVAVAPGVAGIQAVVRTSKGLRLLG